MDIIIDDTPTVFKIALDDLTRARLFDAANEAQIHPCAMIAAIIHDVLEDDARAHDRVSLSH